MSTSTPAPKPRDLVLLHGDGYVEVYGDRKALDVHVSLMLDGSDETAIAREEYMELTLPRRFQELFWPNKLIRFANLQRRTAEQELDRLVTLDILRTLRETPLVIGTIEPATHPAMRASA